MRFDTLQLFGSTRAKAPHKLKRSGPFLRRDPVPFCPAIDMWSVLSTLRLPEMMQQTLIFGAPKRRADAQRPMIDLQWFIRKCRLI